MAEKLKLSEFDIQQPAWQRLKAHYEQRLVVLRGKLENPHTPDADRAGLVWQVHMVKGFLSHGQHDEQNAAGAGV